jgi:hypothetical protein
LQYAQHGTILHVAPRDQSRGPKEPDVPGKALPPYHIGEQYADALLRPVGDTLAELDARLDQYVDRLRLAEIDRQRLEAAQAILADARERLSAVLAASAESS